MPLDVNEFASKIKEKYPEYKDVDNKLLTQKMIEKYPEYKDKVSLETPKKKEVTESQLKQPKVSSSSATQGTEEQKPSVSSGSVKNNVFTGYPGKEGKQYHLKDGVWYEYSSTIPKEGGKNVDLYEKPITNMGRVDALNSFFKQKAYYNEQHKTETKLKDKIIEEQKALKGQGHNVDINGLMDDKTLIAKNKEQAKVVISEKEKARKEKVLTSIDAYINKGLIGNEEEQVVSFLRNKFGKDGFIFEESGAGDNLSISYNANGVTTKAGEISLDNWTTGGDIEEMNKLKSFMKNAYMTTSERKEVANASNVRDLVKLMGRNPLKYGKEIVSEDVFNNHIDKSYMTLSLEQKRLKDDYKQLDLDIQKYNENPSSEKLKELKNRESELAVREYAIVKEYGDIKNATRNYSKAVGTYTADKAKEGNFAGIITGGLLQGALNIEKMKTSLTADVIPYLISPVDPMTEQKLKATGYTDAQIKDYAAKELKQRLLPKLKEGIQKIGTAGTTTLEYVNSEDRNDIEKTANFLSESIGTALSAGGNPVLTKVAFFAQSYNAMEEQMMNGSDFEGLTENQKKLVSVPYGIVIGALEKLGFEIGTGQNAALNGAVSKVIARTFTELPKDASIQLIEKTLAQNAKTMIAQGVARVGVSALSEGFVEGVQNVAETGEKYLVNKIEGFDYFQNVPDITTSKGVMSALNEARTDAYYGFLGGLVMSGLSQSYNAAKNGFNEKQNDLKFEDWLDGISDDKLVQATKLDIKTKLANGDLTKEQAQEQIEGIDKAKGILNEIPAEYSVRDKRTSFNLIQEKKKLEKDIQGKDEASVFAQKERINAINEELKTISLNNATKESTEQQQEIPTESNISERQGTTEGQQEVGKGEGSERTAEKPEANISDSNIPSEAEVNYAPEDKARLDKINIVLSKDINTVTDEEIASMISAKKEKTEIENKYGLNDIELKHGTPHDFNKFETEKIGTGEGAQAFGYGLYFTENSKIAKGYADKLSKDKSGIVYTVKIKNGKTNNWLEWREPIDASQAVELSKVLKSRKDKYNEYLSNIDDEKSHTGAAESLFEGNIALDDYRPISNASLYNDLSDAFGQNEASKIMSEAGIDGVKYNTRQGKGSDFNYVVFNPESITITKKESTVVTPTAQVIPSIETKIEEHEQRTENEVVAPNTETTKTKKAKSIPRTRKALEVETNDLQDIVKKHFISGGKVNVNSAMQSLFGNKRDKSVASEYRKRIGLHSKGGQTIDGLAHLLWEQNRDTLGESVTTTEWRDAVESVLTNEVGTKNMIDSLMAKSEESVTDAEAKYWEDKYDLNALEGFDESELMDAESVLDNMTDEEMAKMYDEIVASEQAEYNPTIEDAKKLDPKDKLYSKKVYDILESQKQALIQFSKESSGAFIIPPSVLVKVIEGLQKAVELGMTFEEAIRDYASKNNMRSEDIENSLFNLSETQKRKTRERLTGEKQPIVRQSKESVEAKELSKRKTKKVIVDEVKSLKDQIKLEAKAAKEGAKSVSDAIKAITRHFNSLSEKDKLNRKDLIKIINLISKVKNPETLNNTIPKLFDIMDNANKDIIEVNERLALKTQLKLEAKAAKNVDLQIRKKQKEVQDEISEMYKKGKITSAQNRIILRKLANVNFLKDESVNKFLEDYAKLINNAEYAQKVSDGFDLRDKIKSVLKKQQDTLKGIAKEFVKINPLVVEDIDAYNALAEEMFEATKTGRFKADGMDGKTAIEYNYAVSRINEMLEHQNELVKQRLMEEYDYLVEEGIINSDMSLKDIETILNAVETSENKSDIDEALVAAKSLLKAGLSALSFHLNEQTEKSELMQKVAHVDVELLDRSDITKLAEAIDNYIVNGVTDGVGAIMAKHNGRLNSKIAEKTTRATRFEYVLNRKDIVSLFNKSKAKSIVTKRKMLQWRAENFLNLPALVDRIFKGVTNATEFIKLSGLDFVERGITKHQILVNKLEVKYHNKFTKAKMKFGRFNDALNQIERFIYADLSRNAGKTEVEANVEFNLAYDNIQKSINTLKNSSVESDQIKGKLYEAALSKIKKGTYAEFLENPGDLDPVNIDAVKFAVDSFNEVYDDLARVSLDYYNTELKPEANYASSRYIKSVNPTAEINDEMDFRDEKMITTKETKPMKAAKRTALKEGEYIDGTFDVNFFKTYKEAMLAIHTSEARMQLKEFMKDKNLSKIIKDIEDRTLLEKAVANYISDTMGYTRDTDNKQLLKIIKYLDKYAAVKNLGSVYSVVKQSVPVALTTGIITGEIPLPLNPLEGVSKDINDFLERNNVSASLRGEENAIGQKRANKYRGELVENTESIKNKIGHAEETLRSFSMKPLVVGDTVVNKLSWIAFYKQKLREQGIDTKNIDWETHEMNEGASVYATHMVERSQNPSDFNKMAKFFKEKGQWANIIKSVLLPYSSFNINAKKKMVADLNTLKDKNTSDFDKMIAIRSLIGTVVEMISFNALGMAWRYLAIKSIASALTGDDEDDEDDLKREQKYIIENIGSELISPSPVFNEATLVAYGYLWDKYGRDEQDAIDAENKKREENGEEKMTDIEEKKLISKLVADKPTHEAKMKNFFDSFGSLGTIGKQAYETFELGETINNKYFIDKYKNLKELTPQQIDKLKALMIVDGLTNIMGIPKDVKAITKTAEKNILFNSLSEAGMRRLNETQEYLGRDLTDVEFKLARKSKNTDNLIYVIDELKGKEKAKEEAFKLLKEGVDIVDFEIMDKLRAGKTAEQIMKEVE